MARYIELDALVAEIEKLIDKGKYHDDYNCVFRDGNNAALYALKERLDTLEVKEIDTEQLTKLLNWWKDVTTEHSVRKAKEVDFSTEVYKYIDEHFNVYDDEIQTLQTKDKKSLIGMVDVENIAQHFFELGMQISNKAQKGE